MNEKRTRFAPFDDAIRTRFEEPEFNVAGEPARNPWERAISRADASDREPSLAAVERALRESLDAILQRERATVLEADWR